MEKMQKAGVQFGYSKTRRHPSAIPFIGSSKNRTDLFDLTKTKTALDKAREFVSKITNEGKIILFVGTKPESRQIVKDAANKLKQPFVTNRWIGGTLTNLPEIRKRVARLKELRESKQSGELEKKYTKKEQLLFAREALRLEENFGGIIDMEKIPGALFIIDSKHEDTAVREARQLKIPVISVSSSDCDLSLIDYPIPANDAATSSINLLTAEIASAYSAK